MSDSAKIAHWTPSPQLEKEEARTLSKMTRARMLSRAGVVAVCIALPFSCLLLFTGPLGIPFVFLLFFGSVWLGNRVNPPIQELAEGDLFHEFGITEGMAGRSGWLVTLMVHQGNAPTGTDRGILWIEDDRLYFAGRRTSFGLTADQVDGLAQLDPATPGIRNDLELRLLYPTSAGALGVSFSGIDPLGRRRTTGHMRMRGAINRWIGQGAATDGQLPPLDLGPDAPTLAKLSMGALGALGFWTAIVLAFPVLYFLAHPLVAIAEGFVGLLVGSLWHPVWSPGLRFRAWNDQRRLARRR